MFIYDKNDQLIRVFKESEKSELEDEAPPTMTEKQIYDSPNQYANPPILLSAGPFRVFFSDVWKEEQYKEIYNKLYGNEKYNENMVAKASKKLKRE